MLRNRGKRRWRSCATVEDTVLGSITQEPWHQNTAGKTGVVSWCRYRKLAKNPFPLLSTASLVKSEDVVVVGGGAVGIRKKCLQMRAGAGEVRWVGWCE